MDDELRPLGRGRYACRLTTPWGQEVPAEVIVATERGWTLRAEAADPRWVPLPVGPVVLAVRLVEPDRLGAGTGTGTGTGTGSPAGVGHRQEACLF